MNVKTTEKIKILCVHKGISVAELARLTNQTPQNLANKMKKNNFSERELRKIASAVGTEFELNFVLKNGDKI
ncbi:MAG: helix-turn-helix transcriptional regulator [Endomicrobium sp.]|jgi:transcriptional regulator with XRE-family HTH domain|nr:helix-turn-helix transcriptional regulator [Endomicrobium sp.]